MCCNSWFFADRLICLLVFFCIYEVVDTIDEAESEADLHFIRKNIDPDRTVVFTSIVEPPFLTVRREDVSIRRPHHRHHDYEGFIPDLVAKIAQKLRISYRLKLVSDGGYGIHLGDGKWNGMIGEVMTKTADVAVGALSIKPARMRVVDFTNPYLQVGIAAVLPKQTEDVLPRINSATDLANQSEISYGCIRGSQTYHYFRMSNNSLISGMWRHMTTTVPSPFEWSSRAGIERVRKSDGKYAFLVESAFAEYLAYQPPCDLTVTSRLINPSDYAFAVPKNSDLLDKLNQILGMFRANGVLEKLLHKWWRSKCVPRTSSGSGKTKKTKLLSNDDPGSTDPEEEVIDLVTASSKKGIDNQQRSGLPNKGHKIPGFPARELCLIVLFVIIQCPATRLR